MATFNLFDSVVKALGDKKINLGTDSLKVALCAAASAPDADLDSVLADVTEISYTNLSSRVLTTTSFLEAAGVAKLILADLVLTAAGGAVAAFRYVLVYSDTSTNDDLIGFLDYGENLTLFDGDSLTLDFHVTNGALTITATT